jgi:hypothetical protein
MAINESIHGAVGEMKAVTDLQLMMSSTSEKLKD